MKSTEVVDHSDLLCQISALLKITGLENSERLTTFVARLSKRDNRNYRRWSAAPIPDLLKFLAKLQEIQIEPPTLEFDTTPDPNSVLANSLIVNLHWAKLQQYIDIDLNWHLSNPDLWQQVDTLCPECNYHTAATQKGMQSSMCCCCFTLIKNRARQV
jgi:hypothetical protein